MGFLPCRQSHVAQGGGPRFGTRGQLWQLQMCGSAFLGCDFLLVPMGCQQCKCHYNGPPMRRPSPCDRASYFIDACFAAPVYSIVPGEVFAWKDRICQSMMQSTSFLIHLITATTPSAGIISRDMGGQAHGRAVLQAMLQTHMHGQMLKTLEGLPIEVRLSAGALPEKKSLCHRVLWPCCGVPCFFTRS